MAEDANKGLALLRVYGSRHLSPLPLSPEAAAGPELTLVGVADPKPQVLAEAVGAKLPPVATIIPFESIRNFHTAHGVEPLPGRAEDAKASVLRIICVRK